MCADGAAGASFGGTPRFVLGMCAGTTNIYGDATTDHFVGFRTSVATWNYNGTDDGWATLTHLATKRVGVTDTDSTSLGSQIVTNARATKRFMCILEITKGSPNFSLRTLRPSSLTTGDTSLADFKGVMELPVMGFAGYSLSLAQTIAVDEGTDGNLTAGCIFWDQALRGLEFSDFNVVKVS
jgi:hypothetical protein